MQVTMRDIRLAESQRDAAAMQCRQQHSGGSLALLFSAVLHLYQVRSKWLKRRKTGRAA